MKNKTVGRLFLVLLVLSVLSLITDVHIGKANPTIVINPDGSITPSTAPIQRNGDLYTFTSDIYDSIQVMKSNIIVDGNNFKLQGTGSGTGFILPHAYMNVTIRNTAIKGFSWGIYTQDTSNSAIKNCVISNNTVGISLNDSPGITVSGNILSNNTDAIRYWYMVYFGPQNWVNNIITNNNNGIIGRGLLTANIMNNIITDNTGTGIQVRAGFYNVISHNTIERNDRGIHFFSQLDGATNNNITDNTLAYNSIGVQIDPGDTAIMKPMITGNSFYHNNFIYNTQQTYTPLEDVLPQPNSWDNGYPSGGNFWSNYTGVDLYSGSGQNVTGSDGIGDTPYVVAQENVDEYPLMTPYDTTEFFVLRITATTGGTTNPAPGPYVYTPGTTVEVTAVPEADYMLDYWELDNVDVGATNPVSVTMNTNHALKAVFKTRPDIAVTSIVPYPTTISSGQLVYINVTVSNLRFTSETFDVVVYADRDRKVIGDEIIVGVQTVYNLLPGGTKTITFVWDTSGLPSGTAYYISAKAIVPNDIDPTNNLLTAKKKVSIRR